MDSAALSLLASGRRQLLCTASTPAVRVEFQSLHWHAGHMQELHQLSGSLAKTKKTDEVTHSLMSSICEQTPHWPSKRNAPWRKRTFLQSVHEDKAS